MTDIRTDEKVDGVGLPDPRPSDTFEALSWLGETEEEIVRSLRERGIKGDREKGGSHHCVIANYLRLWWSGPISVCSTHFHAAGKFYMMSRTIGTVINKWDDYQYPDLIAD